MGLDPLPAADRDDRYDSSHLQLITGKTLHYLNSSYSHMERHRHREGVLEIDLHPDDAAQRSLHDGQLVRVSSDLGELQAICRISDVVGRGVASMPFGTLTDAAGTAHGVNVLTPEAPTDWGGGCGYYSARVVVEAAG